MTTDSMRSAVIRKYGAAADVLTIETSKVPQPGKHDVLVRQYATSVNPIDYRMRGGYGRVMLSKLRGFELPLVLGRDIAGEVVKTGSSVTNLKVGDRVFGVASQKSQGTYSEYVVASSEDLVSIPQRKGENSLMDFEEAAALPYVACTVWDALVTKAALGPHNSAGKKVFVQGGSGGIGSVAIQLLKSWGAYVATTCSTSQVESVYALGADEVIDYTTEDYSTMLSDYDVALETVGGPLEKKTLSILRQDGEGVFVTLIHPLLQTFDDSGLVRGGVKNLSLFTKAKCRAREYGVKRYYWSIFKPSNEALSTAAELVGQGRLNPKIDCTFELSEIAAAHQYCEQGNAHGKVVIKIG